MAVVLIFQHSDHGGPGRLGMTLRDHGIKTRTVRPDKGDAVPGDLDGVHGLVVLGGPQNVTDAAKYPWMEREMALIRAAHATNRPVIGICLGHQMIAKALGGEVAPRAKARVGFAMTNFTPTGQVETILGGMPWQHPQFFSCGQEVTTLPPGAAVLSGTKDDKFQAFRVGLRTFGFQFHFECDQPGIEGILAHSKDEAASAGITVGEVKVQMDHHYAAYARISDRLCVNIATLCFPVTQRLSA